MVGEVARGVSWGGGLVGLMENELEGLGETVLAVHRLRVLTSSWPVCSIVSDRSLTIVGSTRKEDIENKKK